jgi:replicative DNA helicase
MRVMTGRPSDADDAPQPHNIEAEQGVLGCLLTDNDALTRVSDILEAAQFYDPLHGEIFSLISNMIDEGRTASPITIKSAMDRHPGLEELGGPAYLVRLGVTAPPSSMIREYAEIVVDLSAKRQILDLCEQARDEIASGRKPASAVSAELEVGVGQVAATTTTRPLVQSHLRGLTSAVAMANEGYQGGAGSVGVTTGIDGLDKKLGKLRKGQMILMAGRSSMGKTSVAQAVIYAAARARTGVFFASLEMSREELSHRFISLGCMTNRGAKIPYSRITSGHLTEDEFRTVVDEAKAQEGLPIFTGERECRDMMKMRSAARQAQRQFERMGAELGLVVIDYAQLLTSRKARSSYDRVSEASDFIKTLAMDLDVPVIALSQLSRGVEQRDPPVPQLSDLRESGKLEEDADVVLLLYRAEYYLQRELERARSEDDRVDLQVQLDRARGALDVIIAKQRNGPTGRVRAYLQPEYCWVGEEKPLTDGDLI